TMTVQTPAWMPAAQPAADDRFTEPAPEDACGLRVYTRDPITAPWLQHSIVPLVAGLQARGYPQIWLRRGWLHGPHVDIFAHRAPGQNSPWAELAARLSLPPSDLAAALSPQDYLAQAREFGRLEAVPPPYLPFADHGACRYLSAAEQHPRADALADLAERVAVLSALCGPMIDTITELGDRPQHGPKLLAEAFLALADSYFLGLAHGSFSFRSHAEAFFAWSGRGEQLRVAFAERLGAQAEQLRPLVEQRLAGAVSPAAARWRVAFGYSCGALDAAVARGSLTSAMVDSVLDDLDAREIGPPSDPGRAPTGPRPDTAFHDAVAAAGVLDAPPPWFAAYRVLINLFYQQLPLLTVSAMQRYYMCYAIAELIDEVLGESWQNRLQREQITQINRTSAP
ncbi:MAG: hypothetical protein ACRC0L_05170, partial [Angustibacter sp.]